MFIHRSHMHIYAHVHINICARMLAHSHTPVHSLTYAGCHEAEDTVTHIKACRHLYPHEHT